MKPEDAMYEILDQLGMDYERHTPEVIETKKLYNKSYKDDIVNFINKEKDETYIVLDIFRSTNKHHGGLYYLGYKILKDYYTFYEAEITFTSTLSEFTQVARLLKGLHYITKPNKESKSKVYCTDAYIVDILKLSGGNIKDFT